MSQEAAWDEVFTELQQSLINMTFYSSPKLFTCMQGVQQKHKDALTANLSPYIDSPPVPVPCVKSPPCNMKLGMILWNLLPSYVSFFPFFPCPFSPVHRALKFSTVFGTTSPNNPKVMRPAKYPSLSSPSFSRLGQNSSNGCMPLTCWLIVDFDVKEYLHANANVMRKTGMINARW